MTWKVLTTDTTETTKCAAVICVIGTCVQTMDSAGVVVAATVTDDGNLALCHWFLTNALKVTGGPDDSVFAIIEGDTVVKYNKRKETWEPFSDKENIHEVAANGAGGVYFQTKDLELFATSDEPLLEEQIIDCR